LSVKNLSFANIPSRLDLTLRFVDYDVKTIEFRDFNGRTMLDDLTIDRHCSPAPHKAGIDGSS
jgi:hypothetical protein